MKRAGMRRFFLAYGMLAVLLALCVFFTVSTYHSEAPSGQEGGEALAAMLLRRPGHLSGVVIVISPGGNSADFMATLAERLKKAGVPLLAQVTGDPHEARQSLAALAQSGSVPEVIATTPECRNWAVWNALRTQFPAYARTQVLVPLPQTHSIFLSSSNLRNIADQIAVIAILAVGMTMVIITGGIDLSVGSLIALSAVATAWGIRAVGGVNASPAAMFSVCLAAIAVSGVVGIFSGLMITRFRIPPFIATLAMMQVASGLAFMVTQGQSIYAIPPSFTWLGRSAALLSLPNAVVLMGVLYIMAHLMMARMRIGRNIYAVGGNTEAARLSGIPIQRTLLFVYLLSGLLAGVGGVIMVSQLKAGAPTYGVMYELYVIAAVVVGGTSLSGGEGYIFGTLIGAFIIAVIRNGMNLMNVEPYTQKVVLGLVILGAVLIDRLKRRGRN